MVSTMLLLTLLALGAHKGSATAAPRLSGETCVGIVNNTDFTGNDIRVGQAKTVGGATTSHPPRHTCMSH